MAKWSGQVGSGSGRVNQFAGQTGCRSKMDHFRQVKRGSGQLGCGVN